MAVGSRKKEWVGLEAAGCPTAHRERNIHVPVPLFGGFLCLCLSLGAGCMAVPVGRPEAFRHEWEEVETGTQPERARMERARVVLRQHGERAVVSIDAELAEDFAKKHRVRHVTVIKRRRLAFGLFPAAAELVWMPKRALQSTMGVFRAHYTMGPPYCGYYVDANPGIKEYVHDQLIGAVGLGLLHTLGTLDAFLLEPFRPWRGNEHDCYDAECWCRRVEKDGRWVADASESPRIRALAKLPEDMRRAIGASTCFDVRSTGVDHPWKDLALAGFHKYLEVYVDVEEAPAEVFGAETRMRTVAVEGPCEIELSIPGVGFSERRVMERWKTEAVFELPAAAHEMSIEARVSVREAPGAGRGRTSERTREAVRLLMGQASRFDVNLRAGAGEAGTREGETFEIEGIRATREGRYEVRVRVADASRRETVAAAVAPEVRRRIREDYAERHPEARVGEVRDWVSWTADAGDPEVLVFEGWAFSARILSEGWRYDAATRRGEVRVLVVDGVPTERAAEWARENIAAIVADKGIAQEAGKKPAASAEFRCLGERFEDGILAISFEEVP